jgi:hypothetical protein
MWVPARLPKIILPTSVDTLKASPDATRKNLEYSAAKEHVCALIEIIVA